MVAVFAPGRNWLALTRPEIPLAERAVATVGWDAFLALLPAATYALVALPETERALWYERLRAVRAAYPFLPVVLVCDAAPPHALARAVETVRPPVTFRRLWPAMQRAATRMLLLECARRMPAPEPPDPLRDGLELACLGAAAQPSVLGLARALGVPAALLRARWQSVVGSGTGATLDEVLDWVLLLRLCAERLDGRPGAQPGHAPTLPVHRHTLSRVSLRLVQLPIRHLTPDTAPRLRVAFRRAVLDPLTSESRAQ